MTELAFEGAMGYGQYAQGGSGGTEMVVTTLADSGPGSLREALTATGPRIVTFAVAGTIELSEGIWVSNPYLTLDGSTAPGKGICLRMAPGYTGTGSPIVIRTHDVIVRYIRSRPGPGGQPDALTISSTLGRHAHDIIIDHCSFSWAVDKNVEINGTYSNPDVPRASNITIQNCLIAEGLMYSTHDKGDHSKGLLAFHCENVSILRNVFYGNEERNPQLMVYGRADLLNNLIYHLSPGWANATKMYDDWLQPDDPQHYNIIRNLYLYGANASPAMCEVVRRQLNGAQPHPNAKFFLHGNIGPHRPDDTYPQDALYEVGEFVNGQWVQCPKDSLTTSAHAGPPRPLWAVSSMWSNLFHGVGATLPARDSVDTRILNHIKNGTGALVNDPAEVGGWPELEETE